MGEGNAIVEYYSPMWSEVRLAAAAAAPASSASLEAAHDMNAKPNANFPHAPRKRQSPAAEKFWQGGCGRYEASLVQLQVTALEYPGSLLLACALVCY